MQIEITGLTVRYDSVTALSDVSYQINKGDFVGITGPNGGGKTSFLRALLGLKRRSGVLSAFTGTDNRYLI